jgi:MFS family permease
VPWFDLLSNAIPPRRRGRLTGTGQVVSGILGFGAGLLVEWMLSANGPPFPSNYAFLFLLGFVMLGLSFLALTFAVERESVSVDRAPSWREYIPQLWRVLKRDRVFRRFIVAKQLSGLGGLAIPFYVPYALERLNLPAQVTGRYTSIGVIGGILAAVPFGWLNERYGSRLVLRTGLVIGILVPIIALLVPVVAPNPTWMAWGYGLVFFCLSAQMSSMMAGWMTYVLEWAPEAERPTYVGLTNTLNGIATLFATLGGLILEWSGENYELLFAITIGGLVLAWPLPSRLPEPRRRDAPSS